MAGSIGIAAAFGAGIVSFLSPCILPLIPGYLAFMTGMTTSELSDRRSSWSRTLPPALLFVAGFTLVFVALGASASIIGQSLVRYRDVVEKIAGVAVVAFGILMLGIIKVPWLYGEARMDLGRSRSFGRVSALVMGMAFAAGWTPCVGPILGAVLALAGSSGSVGRGALLLVAYSLGLGLPFIAVALLFGRMAGLMRWLAKHSLVLNRIAGSMLVVIGVLIFTGQLARLSTWLTGLL